MSFESMQSIKSSQSNLVSEILMISLEDNFKDILELFNKPEVFEEFENSKSETCLEFPNDAYKNLMLLITKHKLNNKADNNIICSFNKHSNLTKSPLPNNIQKG